MEHSRRKNCGKFLSTLEYNTEEYKKKCNNVNAEKGNPMKKSTLILVEIMTVIENKWMSLHQMNIITG